MRVCVIPLLQRRVIRVCVCVRVRVCVKGPSRGPIGALAGLADRPKHPAVQDACLSRRQLQEESMAGVHGGDLEAGVHPLRRRLHAYNRRPGGSQIAHKGGYQDFRRPERPLHQRRAHLSEVGFGIFVGGWGPGPRPPGPNPGTPALASTQGSPLRGRIRNLRGELGPRAPAPGPQPRNPRPKAPGPQAPQGSKPWMVTDPPSGPSVGSVGPRAP